MDREAYNQKRTKLLRNQNIAYLYFEKDLTSREIREQYPDITISRICQIAHQYKDSYNKEEV